MATNYICPMCHNTTFHFDRSRHAVVCDVCGYAFNNAETVAEMVEYDKNRQKAIAYVKAYDYASAKPYLDRMRQIRPDDSDIYYLHLMGLTDQCKNLLLEPADESKYSLAEKYWRVFCALNGEAAAFRSYFAKREQALQSRLRRAVNKAITVVFVCCMVLLLSAVLYMSINYWALIPMLGCVCFICKYKPFSALVKVLHKK